MTATTFTYSWPQSVPSILGVPATKHLLHWLRPLVKILAIFETSLRFGSQVEFSWYYYAWPIAAITKKADREGPKMKETDDSYCEVAAGGNGVVKELNTAHTSGNSPPSRRGLLLWQRRLEEREAEVRKMSRYIARCIPDEGIRITLWDGNSDYPPTIADLTPLWAEGEVEILIESNDPEQVDLDAVYEHFRWQDMTLAERWRHLMYVPLTKQVDRLTSPPPVPHWNSELRTLFFGGQVVKQFKQRARNQEPILVAFEEVKWPPQMDDPMRPSVAQRKRLNDTIYELNQKHRTPGLIRFSGDGSGEGIIWTALHSG